MDFHKLVEQTLHEEVVAGGEGSAFGSAASEPYGQHMDPRTPFVMGGVMSRFGMKKKKKSKKRRKKKK
jgi:hypothetical protein